MLRLGFYISGAEMVANVKKGIKRIGRSALQLDALGLAIRAEAKSEAGLPSGSDRMFGRCLCGAGRPW